MRCYSFHRHPNHCIGPIICTCQLSNNISRHSSQYEALVAGPVVGGGGLLLEGEPPEVDDHRVQEAQPLHVKLHQLGELLTVHFALHAGLDYRRLQLELSQELGHLLHREVVQIAIWWDGHFGC